MKIITPALCALFFVSAVSAQVSAPAQRPDLAKLADSGRIAAEVPELAYVVIGPEKIQEYQVLGFHRSDLQQEETKAKTDDYFHLGSNTKAITGFIAAYLVENNKIQWNTRFFDLFPELQEKGNPGYIKMTLEDLLSHRAKIRPYTSGAENIGLPKFEGDVSTRRKQFVAYVLSQKPVESEGELFDYSNAGYSVATLMLEKVSGKTWEILVEEVLHKKLKLRYKLGWPNTNDPNQPWGHWIENGKLKPLPGDITYKLSNIEPAGDISMPLMDYARFIQLNLQGLLGKNNLLKTATYEYLHYGRKEYAIGWGNVNEDLKQTSSHAGSAGTFYCVTFIDKKNKFAYVIAANAATAKAQKMIRDLAKQITRKYKFD